MTFASLLFMHALRRPLAAAALLLTTLCLACGGVTLRPIGSSVQRPSNVAVYLEVENDGEPVTGLTTSNFAVAEDGVLLDPSETRLSLLDPAAAAQRHALVLVDLGGEFDERSRESLRRGVALLLAALRPSQSVTVLGFDGSARLHPLGEFPRSADEAQPDLATLQRFRSKDESRNLNGAVLEALRQLDARLKHVQRPVRVGTLVVFTQGDDLAGRAPEAELNEALEKTPHQIYAIGVEGRESRQLAVLGKDGVQRSQDASTLPLAFEELGMRLRKAVGKFYLLQYCSPARSGVRRVTFTVDYEDEEGKDHRGSLDLEFDATGFSGGCNPKATPSFAKPLAEPGQLRAEGTDASPKAAPEPPSPATDSEAPPSDAEAEGDDDGIVAPPPSGNYAD